MSAPAVVVVTCSIDDLRAAVRDAVREVLAGAGSPPTMQSLVGRHELARQLGVSPATITRMTAEGMPHVFAGASPRYALDEVRAWLMERGRKGTKASLPKREVIGGVRLLSRGTRP